MEIISKESLAITKDQEIAFWSKVAVTNDNMSAGNGMEQRRQKDTGT
ncbi:MULTISPECIES: hypothetical protein [unclassified Providencia]|nr:MULTISPECIES: hypothetical protein [unclassified Providencia]